MAKKPDISFANGFLLGRMVQDVAGEDGYEETNAGVLVRIRVSEIIAYCAGTQSVVEVSVRGVADGYDVWGTMKEMDTVMALDRIRVVNN